MFRLFKKHREKVKKYLLVFFLAIVSLGMVLVFTPLGGGDMTQTSADVLATVGGTRITMQDLRQSIDTQIRNSSLGNDPRNRDALLGMAAEARGQIEPAVLAYRELTVLAPASGWADGAADVEIFTGALTRQAGPGQVDFADFVGQVKLGQTIPICSKRIGLKKFCACLDVAHVDFFYQMRRDEVQFVKAPVEGYTLSVQHGAHGAVADQGPLLESLKDRFAHAHRSLSRLQHR